MRKFIAKYVDNCHQCRRNKPTRHLPYGELKPLDPPTKPFQDITMDFIVKLPLSNGYDSILVIVDRLTKYSKIFPFKESHTAEELADFYIDHIGLQYGFPLSLLTD